MTPAMDAAFSHASGFSSGHIGVGIVLIVAAVACLWTSNAVRVFLSQLMHDSRLMKRNSHLLVRALILLMTILYLLS